MQTKIMKGEWNNEKWISYENNTLVKHQGINYLKINSKKVVAFDKDVGEATIYEDFFNSYGDDARIAFTTIQCVPRPKQYQGTEYDRLFTPSKRHNKRGHVVKTLVHDMVDFYLNKLECEHEITYKNKYLTKVTIYKGEEQ